LAPQKGAWAIRLAWKTSNAYGVVTLEAKWLVPKGAIPEDIAKDPKSCLISVTIELREHPVAHAARVVRESGATPTQVKVGIQLALGKTKPVIADELGIKLSSVADQAKRLYQYKNLAGRRAKRNVPISPARLGHRAQRGFTPQTGSIQWDALARSPS
jgi:hypothetical protein